jgi:perosamine synthetase
MGISVFKPTIKRRDMDSVLTCMVSDRIGPGALSSELASQLASYLGISGGMACSSYYASLRIALDALGLGEGDRIVISALSPSLYLDVFEEKGLVPLIADVDTDSGSILIERVRELLKQFPKALIVHYTLGYIPDMEGLSDLGLPMIEDLSQGLGGNWGTRRCGSFGDLVILSLGPESIITSGDGGVILTGKTNLLRYLREIKSASDCILSNFNASLGLAQVKEIESFIATRAEIARVFSRSLMKSRHETLVQKGEGDNVYFSFPVVIQSSVREARQYSRKRDIDTRPAFSDSVVARRDDSNSCPNAKRLALRCLLFPCYPMLGKKNTETISKVLSTLP